MLPHALEYSCKAALQVGLDPGPEEGLDDWADGAFDLATLLVVMFLMFYIQAISAIELSDNSITI